jgi:hypothetical protein
MRYNSLLSVQKYCAKEVRIKIKLPKIYHQDTFLARLVIQHTLQVRILAAILEANTEGDGWLDLVLTGEIKCLANALEELAASDIEIWYI